MKTLIISLFAVASLWGQCSTPCINHTFLQSSTTATTSAVNMTGAVQIVIALNYAIVTPNLSDSAGNSYTQRSVYGPNSAYLTAIYTCTSLPCLVNSSQTFTMTCSASCYASMFVAGFSGAGTFDQNNGNATCVTTTCQPGSITPAVTGNLVVTGAMSTDTSAPPTVNSGFHITDAVSYQAGGTFVSGGGLAWILAAASTSYNPTWTAADTIYCASIASFLAATAATYAPLTLIIY